MLGTYTSLPYLSIFYSSAIHPYFTEKKLVLRLNRCPKVHIASKSTDLSSEPKTVWPVWLHDGCPEADM